MEMGKMSERGSVEWFIQEFKAARIVFHRAHKALIDFYGIEEEEAYKLLWPDIEEGEKGWAPGPMPDEGQLKDWMIP